MNLNKLVYIIEVFVVQIIIIIIFLEEKRIYSGTEKREFCWINFDVLECQRSN